MHPSVQGGQSLVWHLNWGPEAVVASLSEEGSLQACARTLPRWATGHVATGGSPLRLAWPCSRCGGLVQGVCSLQQSQGDLAAQPPAARFSHMHVDIVGHSQRHVKATYSSPWSTDLPDGQNQFCYGIPPLRTPSWPRGWPAMACHLSSQQTGACSSPLPHGAAGVRSTACSVR